MSDPIEIDLDDEDRLADPPLLDFLHKDPADGAFVITFTPRDTVSPEPTETVRIHPAFPGQNSDANRISTFLNKVQSLLGAKVDRITHELGGNYTFMFADGTNRSFHDYDNAISHEVFDRLKQIAEVAEFAFIDSRLAAVKKN